MDTLILGASGFVGGALLQAMAEAGEPVRAASHHPVHRAPRRDVEWMTCDLERPETLAPVLAGVDCAYYLVHSMGTHGHELRGIERRCAENVAAAAAAAGVRRIVYLGGVAPAGMPSEHLASRLLVGEILRGGTVPTIELRASMIVGNGSASWQIIRDLAARLPFMLLPRWLESNSCPIALPDAVVALRDASTVPLDGSTWFDIPGPDTLSVREMLAIVAELQQRRIPSVRVPVLTPKLSAMWLKLVTRANYRIARELVLGLGSDLLPESRRYWELTGHPPRWSFRDAASLALAEEPRGSTGARVVERIVQRIGPHVGEPAT
jgi:uncharacterized protein YbjT (DUF2867 family)